MKMVRHLSHWYFIYLFIWFKL